MKPLSRRTFLRGLGVGVALPTLESLRPGSQVFAEMIIRITQPGRDGYIREFPTTLISVECIPRRRVGRGSPGQRRSIQKQDIDSAITIVIESRETGGHSFYNVALP